MVDMLDVPLCIFLFLYHFISSCLTVFTEGVWMNPNLFTWSLNNGNLCHSQYFVIKKKLLQ